MSIHSMVARGYRLGLALVFAMVGLLATSNLSGSTRPPLALAAASASNHNDRISDSRDEASRLVVESPMVTYTLILAKAGSGTGNVIKNPGQPEYLSGNVVTLTAVPDADSVFGAWSGDVGGGGPPNRNPLTVTVDANKLITATFNFRNWLSMTSGLTTTLFGVWGASATDVFAVGANGAILHYTGTAWSPMNSGITTTLYGVWGTTTSNVFAVGANGTILHYNGTAWSVMPSGTTNWLGGVWGASGNDVFVAGSNIILHYDSLSWSRLLTGTTYSSLWGTSGHDVFATGGSGGGHYDGQGWTSLWEWCIGCGGYSSLWGTSSTDIFFAGAAGSFPGTAQVSHYNGTSWDSTLIGSPGQFNSVWGATGRDVFAVGSNSCFGGCRIIEGSYIVHYNGDSWARQITGLNVMLNGVWGANQRDIFVVGDGGTILRYAGPGVISYTLDITTTGTGIGTIGKTPNQADYLVGTVVTLTATPDVGSRFAGWSGDVAGTLGGQTNPLIVTMDAPRLIAATFARADYFVYLPLLQK